MPGLRHVEHVLGEGLAQRAVEVPALVGAVAGADEHDTRQRRIAEQVGFLRLRGGDRQHVGFGHQRGEVRGERQELHEVALVLLRRRGLGTETRALAGRRGHRAGLDQRLRRAARTRWRPVRVGAQEHGLVLLALRHRREQVGRAHATLLQPGLDARVELAMHLGRVLRADVLGVQARLGRDQRYGELDTALAKLRLHVGDQVEVGVDLRLALRVRTEFLARVEPAISADDHARAAFAEQQELDRAPQVGAEGLHREDLVVVRFEAARHAAFDQVRPGRHRVGHRADRRDARRHQDDGAEQERGDEVVGAHVRNPEMARTGSRGRANSSAPRA